MAKQKKIKAESKVENFWGKELEYIMPRQMFNDLTKDCTKADKFQFAIDYINQTYGLLGHVTSLVLEGED